jgi:hypothetical protein
MAGTLRLSNTGTGNGQSTITTAAAGDTTYTLPSGGGTFVTTASTEALTVPFASGTAGAPSVTFIGDTNTGIYSPGADQLAISTNGTGRLFVDSSGHLGLGTSSPSGNLHVVGTGKFSGNVEIGGVGQFGIDADYDVTGASAGKIITNPGITNANSTFTFAVNEGTGAQMQLKGDGACIWSEGSTERARITNDGYLRLVAKGIQFNNDTADANSLDDYEEGTWTVTLTSGGTSPVYTEQSGTYTKIGNLVYFRFYLKLSSVTAASTQIRFSLPFTVGTSADSGAVVGFNGGFNTNAGDTYYIDATLSQIRVHTNTASSRLGTDAGVSLTQNLVISGHYTV